MKKKQSDVSLCRLELSDSDQIARLANNPNVAINLRDIFPQPYRPKDAEDFISKCSNEDPPITFGIEYDNEITGVIGLVLRSDIHKKTAEIGYWLGEPFWNKGIGTLTLKLMTDYAFNELGLMRLECGVLEYNQSSMRILEKCGYHFEGIFKKSLFKNDHYWDEHRYGIINPDLEVAKKDWPSLNQITLHVSNLNASLKFYQKLGFTMIVKTDHYIRLESPGNRNTLSLDLNTNITPGDITIYFEFEGLKNTINNLKESGFITDGEIKEQSWLWKEFRLKDPDGYNICLYQAGRNRLSPPWRYRE